MNICVFCSSSEYLNSNYYQTGYAVGNLLAKRGHTLIFGGYTKGIMGSVAQGAKDQGGKIISVIPAIFNGMRENFEKGADVILTDTMSTRKDKMLELADGIISLPGGVGTWDELFQVIATNAVGETNKPIAILNQGPTQLALKTLLEQGVEEGLIGNNVKPSLNFTSTVEGLFEIIEKK